MHIARVLQPPSSRQAGGQRIKTAPRRFSAPSTVRCLPRAPLLCVFSLSLTHSPFFTYLTPCSLASSPSSPSPPPPLLRPLRRATRVPSSAVTLSSLYVHLILLKIERTSNPLLHGRRARRTSLASAASLISSPLIFRARTSLSVSPAHPSTFSVCSTQLPLGVAFIFLLLIGIGGNSCSQQTVCCEDNSFVRHLSFPLSDQY